MGRIERGLVVMGCVVDVVRVLYLHYIVALEIFVMWPFSVTNFRSGKMAERP